MTHKKLIILGSGVAGATAAIYAARAGLSPVVIAGSNPGGQLTIAGDVENFPGFVDPINGGDLSMRALEQAETYGTEVIYDTVTAVDLSARPFTLTMSDSTMTCDALIIATGATARWLGVDGEAELMGKGVSACATCDGYFFKDRDVVVIGGGNTAVEEALHLSKLCRTVHLIHRGPALKAENILKDRLDKTTNVTIHRNRRVERIVGNQAMTATIGVNTVSTVGEEELHVPADGVFVAIGHDPVTSLFAGQLELFKGGYIRTEPGSSHTSVEGVFAAGDVADPVYRQAITAAGMGCMAALDAEKWISTT